LAPSASLSTTPASGPAFVQLFDLVRVSRLSVISLLSGAKVRILCADNLLPTVPARVKGSNKPISHTPDQQTSADESRRVVESHLRPTQIFITPTLLSPRLLTSLIPLESAPWQASEWAGAVRSWSSACSSLFSPAKPRPSAPATSPPSPRSRATTGDMETLRTCSRRSPSSTARSGRP